MVIQRLTVFWNHVTNYFRMCFHVSASQGTKSHSLILLVNRLFVPRTSEQKQAYLSSLGMWLINQKKLACTHTHTHSMVQKSATQRTIAHNGTWQFAWEHVENVVCECMAQHASPVTARCMNSVHMWTSWTGNTQGLADNPPTAQQLNVYVSLWECAHMETCQRENDWEFAAMVTSSAVSNSKGLLRSLPIAGRGGGRGWTRERAEGQR